MWKNCLMVAALAAAGLTLNSALLRGQYTPTYGAPPAAAAAPTNPALAEAQIDMQKLQIQARLAERVAQIKEDVRHMKADQVNTTPGGQQALWDAEAEAGQARAAADMVRVDIQILDLQMRNGLITPPQQAPGQPMQQPPNNPAIVQVLQLEARKAHIQSGVAAFLRDLRQKQFDYVKSQVSAGALPQEKVADAAVDLESAKASAEIAVIDEGVANSHVQQAGGRP